MESGHWESSVSGEGGEEWGAGRKGKGKEKLKYALALLSEMDSRIRLTHRPDLLLKTALLQLSCFPPPTLPQLTLEPLEEDSADTTELVTLTAGSLKEEVAEVVGEAGEGRGDGGGKDEGSPVEVLALSDVPPGGKQESSTEAVGMREGQGGEGDGVVEEGEAQVAPPLVKMASAAKLKELAAVKEQALRWLVDRKEKEKEGHRALLRRAVLLSLNGSQGKGGEAGKRGIWGGVELRH